MGQNTQEHESELHIMAAILARSNMGMGYPPAERIADLKRAALKHPVSLDSAVVTFCEQFMESDEHYNIFMSEARSFIKDLRKNIEHYVDAYVEYEAA